MSMAVAASVDPIDHRERAGSFERDCKMKKYDQALKLHVGRLSDHYAYGSRINED